MALRYPKVVKEALSAVRNGDDADLSSLTIPRLARLGHVLAREPGGSDDSDDGESRTRDFFLSDNSVDRDNDTIAAAGWDLSEYKINGAVLWAHNNREPNIAAPKNTRIEGKGDSAKLFSEARFPTEEVSPFAALIFRLIQDEIIKNVSVGFIPEEWIINEQRRGIDFVKQKLVEFSVVPVGSHPGAMVTSAKANGYDMAPMAKWCEAWLDNDSDVGLAIADDVEVGALYKALDPWKTRPSGVVVRSSSNVEPEPEPQPAAEPSAIERSSDELAQIAANLIKTELPEARRRAVERLLLQARDIMAGDLEPVAEPTPEPETRGVADLPISESEVRSMVREILTAPIDDDDQIDLATAADVIREEIAELKQDLLREAGRLPA